MFSRLTNLLRRTTSLTGRLLRNTLTICFLYNYVSGLFVLLKPVTIRCLLRIIVYYLERGEKYKYLLKEIDLAEMIRLADQLGEEESLIIHATESVLPLVELRKNRYRAFVGITFAIILMKKFPKKRQGIYAVLRNQFTRHSEYRHRICIWKYCNLTYILLNKEEVYRTSLFQRWMVEINPTHSYAKFPPNPLFNITAKSFV